MYRFTPFEIEHRGDHDDTATKTPSSEKMLLSFCARIV